MKVIIEVANTHGGDLNYMLELVDTFAPYQDGYAIKFQPLRADTLATPDFEWYPVYEKLSFNHQEWHTIISKAKATKRVWLDLFDLYGVEVLEKNLASVDGIKLQVSVLFNYGVFEKLKTIDLADKKIIINVAALDFDEIAFFVDKFEREIQSEELLLEVGFQGYPTELLDSGISKIKAVKERFGKRVVFADHVDGTTDYAVWLPIIALNNGADIIEKHVMLTTRETLYDFYSSINSEQFEKLVGLMADRDALAKASFLNEKEKLYLEKSLLKPLLNKEVAAGQGLSLTEDFDYKRSGQTGLHARAIEQLLQHRSILSTAKSKGKALQSSDFKTATIAVIIACRLKSSRLKEKALLKIGDLTSVEYCLRNAKKFRGMHHVILATSDLESDADLAQYTYDESVVFHQGHPEDVIKRYLDIIDTLHVDVVVRVTADMPFIDNEILQILLDSHFKTGADYTSGVTAAVGTNLEIINTQALRKVKSYFPSADYSEYMTWYFMNNQEHFKINLVDLPSELVRSYRLTLDYDEDLVMFNKIHEALAPTNPDFNLRAIFKYLDENPEVANINSHIQLTYKTDQALIDTLNEKTKIKL
ncbi:cytidylyltransferase domain-containing protein [Flavobacterium sedimenticola]|uniref:N-acetylneuraminate synthase family protein n=1 Tax=Flavobacterium sedimenticola TaxID=3043286 RepID=A0ABT6XRK2_9FLAO|nr:N-acetylneuraminate synthase family protein [Flavobacterium sedimenticola]MDI9257714.1 N-acetylneuraminate synthase family protein [Flavobacterium sedimenticola]